MAGKFEAPKGKKGNTPLRDTAPARKRRFEAADEENTQTFPQQTDSEAEMVTEEARRAAAQQAARRRAAQQAAQRQTTARQTPEEENHQELTEAQRRAMAQQAARRRAAQQAAQRQAAAQQMPEDAVPQELTEAQRRAMAQQAARRRAAQQAAQRQAAAQQTAGNQTKAQRQAAAADMAAQQAARRQAAQRQAQANAHRQFQAAQQHSDAYAPMDDRRVHRQRKNRFPIAAVILSVVGVVIAIGLVVGFLKVVSLFKSTVNLPSGGNKDHISVSESISTTTEEPTEPETTVPVPEHVVTTASLGAMGDLLMHKPIFSDQYNAEVYQGGTYNFTSVFQHLAPALKENDVNVANLETTLAGPNKPYSGFPNFNCPDTIVDYARDAGFSMLLTANNHCFDTGMDGYLRTLEVTKAAGVETLGTMTGPEDPKFIVKDINDIKIGMLCYTYETTDGKGSYPGLNGLPMYGGSYDMINTFVPTAPQKMYDEVALYIQQMKSQGADAVVMFIHWGVEYQIKENDSQRAIAQELCNLGVDVLIGGHPHVVQPMSLVESTNGSDHKMVCIYSLGNAVSNQRVGASELFPPQGYTEDGALFSVMFEKYSDGKVYLAETNVIPTWVNLRTSGQRIYSILPLNADKKDAWTEEFELNETMFNSCQKSYDRTMSIVGEGLTACQAYLAAQKEAREEYYYDLAWHPEKFLTEATEAPTEAAEVIEEAFSGETDLNEIPETTLLDAA